MGNRRRAREAAVQMLYQMDQADLDAEQAIELFWQNLHGGNADGRDFADALVRGYAAEHEAVNGRIREASRHWRLERMARVDRNILRLATYELMYRDDIPPRVTLNEAVELAKRFGDENSPAFVNGVLDRIAGLR